MSKCVLLNGRQCDIVDYDFKQTDIKKYFEINDFDYIGYHSFGNGYTAWWQTVKEERTSMEITVYAGAVMPIFIDSKVLITKEDYEEEKQIDINLNELKKHFNTTNGFWALMEN